MTSIRLLKMLALGGTMATAVAVPPALAGDSPLAAIDHFVIVYMENRSFDSMFGLFPGANGLANATNAAPQIDRDGKPYAVLPPVIDTNLTPPAPDPRFPKDLPNRPFDIGQYVPMQQKTGDLIHRFYTNQIQIDGGKNDLFVAWSDAKALTMGYYDASNTEQGRLAKAYTLADNFFQGAFGGSFLNHFWLVCACTPRYENPPAALVATFDSSGGLIKDGAVTPDGYAVNTIQSSFQPHDPKITNPALLLPPQSMPTIGDRLSEKGVSWAWYSGGWNDAVVGKADPLFQFHHQPLAYFQQFGDGTAARAEHLKDYVDLEKAIADGALPAVTFYKPIGELNEHPGYSEIAEADEHLAGLMAKLEKSPQWSSTAVIIVPDENGGSWDHVPPPKGDRWGPSTRIPAIIVSTHARKGFVDHTEYDTTSILATLEHRFDLKPLGERDAKVHDLSNAFED
jgi:phospholipase C